MSLLDPQSFQELIFKTLEKRKGSSYVDRQQVRSMDEIYFSSN